MAQQQGPLAKPAQDDTAADRDIGGYPGSVLLVEDEILSRFALSSELQSAGLTVFEAGNVAEALRILDSGAAIAVVFTDVCMPGPLDGIALARIVRDRFPRTTCIVTSGRATADSVPECSFVSKPYDPRAILTLLMPLVRNSAH